MTLKLYLKGVLRKKYSNPETPRAALGSYSSNEGEKRKTILLFYNQGPESWFSACQFIALS